MQRRTRCGAVGALGALALATMSLVATGSLASAQSSEDKVTICHATDSDTNPYVVNTPDKTGDVSGHAGHTGPVWNPTLKAQQIQWGDIIPPFTFSGGSFPGLNWTAEGMAIYNNGCQPVTPTTTTTTAAAATPKAVTVTPRLTG
jgi:hypothetical protein